MDTWAEAQKCLQNNPLKKTAMHVNATYQPLCWCTRSLSLPPTFPFRSGTMGAPLRVQVWGRITENTPRWVSKLQLHCVLLCYVPLSQTACLSSLRNDRSQLLHSGLYRATAPCHESECIRVCMHACCVCLIGIVSISKRPDSHPPPLRETKAGQLMMLRTSLDQLSVLMGDILPV